MWEYLKEQETETDIPFKYRNCSYSAVLNAALKSYFKEKIQ